MTFLNSCSLPKHIDDLRILMNNSPLDVIALNETRLDNLISSGEIGLSGYELVRLDRNRNGGGVAIYVRNSLNFISRHELVPSSIEAVCVEIKKPNCKPFIICSVYRPPNSPTEFFDKYDAQFHY